MAHRSVLSLPSLPTSATSCSRLVHTIIQHILGRAFTVGKNREQRDTLPHKGSQAMGCAVKIFESRNPGNTQARPLESRAEGQCGPGGTQGLVSD